MASCDKKLIKAPAGLPELSLENFNSRLVDLADRWGLSREKDLELRHETGVLLREAFGSPDVRQEYGEGLLKEVSGRLRISVSDISRARRFAKRFQSVADLKRQHPEVGNWTAVKQLLARLSEEDKKAKVAANGTQASKSTKSKAKASPAKGLGKSIDTLSIKLREAKSLTGQEKKELIDKVRKLVQSVSDCLGAQISLNLDNVVESPPLDQPDAETGSPVGANGKVQEAPSGTSQPVNDRGCSSGV